MTAVACECDSVSKQEAGVAFRGVVLDVFRVQGRALTFRALADLVADEWGAVRTRQSTPAFERRIFRALSRLMKAGTVVSRGVTHHPDRVYMHAEIAGRYDKTHTVTDAELVQLVTEMRPIRRVGRQAGRMSSRAALAIGARAFL